YLRSRCEPRRCSASTLLLQGTSTWPPQLSRRTGCDPHLQRVLHQDQERIHGGLDPSRSDRRDPQSQRGLPQRDFSPRTDQGDRSARQVQVHVRNRRLPLSKEDNVTTLPVKDEQGSVVYEIELERNHTWAVERWDLNDHEFMRVLVIRKDGLCDQL